MWFLAIPPLLALHTAAHYAYMNAYVPFYQAFDRTTKHCWAARATALAVQAVVLPVASIWGAHEFCLHVLGMYILTDSIHLAMYDRDPMTWIHHVVTFLSYSATFFVDPDTVYVMMIGTMILEWTSPWIQLCWFANKSGLARRWWFFHLSGFTVLNYFAVRCVGFPYYIITYTPKLLWPSGFFFTVLNWVWLVQLVGYAKAVNKKAGEVRLE
jgi:hypothetical protein